MCLPSIGPFAHFHPLSKKIHSDAIYNAAKAPTKELFNELLKHFQAEKPKEYSTLMGIPIESWTHHATPGHHVVLDQVTSNLAESTMNMIGQKVGARGIPLVGRPRLH